MGDYLLSQKIHTAHVKFIAVDLSRPSWRLIEIFIGALACSFGNFSNPDFSMFFHLRSFDFFKKIVQALGGVFLKLA